MDFIKMAETIEQPLSYDKKCGIYVVLNTLNNMFYVGSSTRCWTRWVEHRGALKKQKHRNAHLQNAWNKYGEENFTFLLIENTSNENACVREQFYLDTYKSFKREIGYNLASNVESPAIGRIKTPEEMEKLKRRMKGNTFSPKGFLNAACTLTPLQVINAKNMLKLGFCTSVIVKTLKISRDVVNHMKKGKTWKHIQSSIKIEE